MEKPSKKDLSQMLISGSSIAKKRGPNPFEIKQQNVKISGKDVLVACKEGDNLDDIAERFNVSRLSAGKLVERLLKKGEDISLSQFISHSRESKIEDALKFINSSSLKKIVEYFKGEVPEEEIRLVRGAMIGKYMDESF